MARFAVAAVLLPAAAFFAETRLVVGRPATPGAVPIALVLGAAAGGLLVWSAVLRRRARGDVATLVRSGPYGFVRNPMALGEAALLFALSIGLGSAFLCAYAILAGLVLHLVVLFEEEPANARRFGPDWERYLAQVPRWIPRPGLAVLRDPEPGLPGVVGVVDDRARREHP